MPADLLWCVDAPAHHLQHGLDFSRNGDNPPPATFLQGCSPAMLRWLFQPCLFVLLGEAAEDCESFSDISRRKLTLPACFPSLHLWVHCRKRVSVALHRTLWVPQSQCCCLASQIHACLQFLFYCAPDRLPSEHVS